MRTTPEFKTELKVFLGTCRTQFILQDVKPGDVKHQRQVVEKLLAPYRALEPHDEALIDSVLTAVNIPEP